MDERCIFLNLWDKGRVEDSDLYNTALEDTPDALLTWYPLRQERVHLEVRYGLVICFVQ